MEELLILPATVHKEQGDILVRAQAHSWLPVPSPLAKAKAQGRREFNDVKL